MNARLPVEVDRERFAWWLVGAVLLGAVGYFLFAFVGTFVLALFIYYGARPMYRRFLRLTGSRDLAATLTLLFIVVPTLLILAYTGVVAFRQFSTTAGQEVTKFLFERLPGNQQSVAAVTRNPMRFVDQLKDTPNLQQRLRELVGAVGAFTGAMFHLSMALVLAFFLYRDGNRLRRWVETEAGGGSAVLAYLMAADRDLEYVYFGNVLAVSIVTLLSLGVYHGFAFVSPSDVSVPVPTLLAVLTGLATFIPLVVGKVVYVPVAAYLFWQSLQSSTNALWFPAAFLVVAFLLLDLIPQSIVRPYLSGRTLHKGAVLFSYLLGATLFGWYGLFLGPLVLVLVVQFANVVLPDLLRGEPFSPRATGTTEMGSDPDEDVTSGPPPGADAAGGETLITENAPEDQDS